MFRSAAAKLTAGYLTIIMALSIGFSVVLYHISSNELARSAQRPVDLYSVVFGPDNTTDINNLRLGQLEKDRNRLKLNLLLFNIAVLAIGGGVSYILARRTLTPIEEALEMQKRFTGDASHELRTPLTAMQTEIEVALRSHSLTKTEAVDILKSNLEEVTKLKNLSEGLLTLATTGGKDASMERVELKTLANQALEAVSKLAKARQIKLINKASAGKVMGNPQQLLNLLSILLDNAIKYSPKNYSVTLKAVVKDRQVLISVVDQGPGIASEDLPHIFERFYRADNSRTGGETYGHGLGLAIAKKITDLHGGSIRVKSKPGKGSTFSVRLPLAKTHGV